MSAFIEDLNEKTVLNDNDLGIIADSEASNQNKRYKFSTLWNYIKSKFTGHGCGVDVDKVDGYDTQDIFSQIMSKGQNLITNGSGILGTNKNFSAFTFDGSQSCASNGSFIAPSGMICSDEIMPIDANKAYRLSFYAKSLLGTGIYFIFLFMYDVDGNPIVDYHHMYIPNTLTTLAQPINNGDTIVHLTSAQNWINTGANDHTHSIIFWNYKNSFGYLYPPETYSRNWAPNLWESGAIDYTNNTITLSSPWSGGFIPAGTYLSNGSAGGAYKYFILVGNTIPTTWTKYSGVVKGIDYSGYNVGGMFAPGTAKVSVGWLSNYNSASGEKSWWANLSFGLDDIEGTSGNAKKWDSHDFSQYLNQAVRTTDQPTFQQLTLAYPADSDYEAVRADKEITISTSSDNGALLVQGLTERTRKLSQSLGFILSLVQSDITLGANTNGLNINNGSSVILGDTNVSFDLPQRIDQDSDFNVKSLDVGKNNNSAEYGTIAHGKEGYTRNIGERAMCSGNSTFGTFADVTKANTCDVHQEGFIEIPYGDTTSVDVVPSMDDFIIPPIQLKDYITFDYNLGEYMKHIGFELNIIVDFVNGGELYDSCSLNYIGTILVDADGFLFNSNEKCSSVSTNYADNTMANSFFRNTELIIVQQGNPLEYNFRAKLRINALDVVSNDWFGSAHTSTTKIGDGNGMIISSWKWEFNVLSSATKFYKQVKKK